MAAVVQRDLPLYALPLHPPSVAILCFSVLISTVLLLRFYRNRSSPTPGGVNNKPPPSPPKIPIIGNLHLLGPLPHHSLRDLSRRHGPLMLLQLGQVPTLVVSSAEMAEEVLKAHDLAFASRPPSRTMKALLRGGRGIAFAPYGEYWRQAKKMCVVHLLSAHRVQGFRPAREEEVARLVGEISNLSSSGAAAVDMSRLLSSFTNSVISRTALGRSAMEEGTTREVAELVAQSLAVLGGFQLENFFPSLAWLCRFTGMDAKVAELAGRWSTLLHRAVEEAAGRSEDEAEAGGFLDVLLSLQKDATTMALSTEEIEAILMSMIAAGTDTSYQVLEGALEELVKNPMAMKKAQDEVRGAVLRGKLMVGEDDVCQMGYLKAVIKEALRLHPPAPLLIPRESMKAVRMQGYEIPTNTRIVINAWAIARDPEYWESPEEFWPERFLNNSIDFKGNDFKFIPFGAGRRICPGIHFATATMELTLANLLFHFNWSLPEGIRAENFDRGEAPGLTTRKKRCLLLMVRANQSPR